MAASFRQRRARAMLFGVAVAIVILLMTVGKTILQRVITPELPGYAKTRPAGMYPELPWSGLRAGDWDFKHAPQIPATITVFDEKPVSARGYLLPLHNPGKSASFFLAEKPRGCYFCNPPGVAEVIQVNVAGGKELLLTDWPVHVYGTLQLATGKANDQVIYTITDATIVIGR